MVDSIFVAMEMKYFKLDEFDSPDLPGSGKNMKPEFLQRIENARALAGVPFKINSGYRTKAANQKAGGKADSSHLTGWAADIDLPNSNGSRFRFQVLSGLIKAGFTRIGISNGFIHCDCDPTKDKEVAWLY